MTEPGADPLIVTALFDPDAAAWFQTARDRHFPRDRNIVPAHLTLFHHLPGADRETIAAQIQSACAGAETIPFVAETLRFFGRGVAFAIDAPALLALRKSLATTWGAHLGAQDQQPFRPHVTIQNKADARVARALYDRLSAERPSIRGTLIGLALWHYRSGPWEAAGSWRFGEAGDGQATAI